MNKLLLGRYINGNSLIHRMDPRSKLALSFYFIGIIFLANNWQTYLLLIAFTFLSLFLVFHIIKKCLFILYFMFLYWLVWTIKVSLNTPFLWQSDNRCHKLGRNGLFLKKRQEKKRNHFFTVWECSFSNVWLLLSYFICKFAM